MSFEAFSSAEASSHAPHVLGQFFTSVALNIASSQKRLMELPQGWFCTPEATLSVHVVGFEVGATVVGSSVGDAVGLAVGAAVGDAVG